MYVDAHLANSIILFLTIQKSGEVQDWAVSQALFSVKNFHRR